MNAHSSSSPDVGDHPLVITRVSDTQWQALADDRVVGSGDASRRPDGRVFLSVDTWHDAAFDRLADAMIAELPAPVHTLVDEHDLELRAAWERAGFVAGRREGEYVVPTDPGVTGLDPLALPPGLTVLPAGTADEGLLRALDRTIRDEIAATVGWQSMPAEVRPLPPGVTVVDPSHYAVAVRSGQYVGLVRVALVTRRPRIGLIAVRADQRRQGVGRALLAHALGALHLGGTDSAWAEAQESNAAALTLLQHAGARRVGGNLELLRN
jgi:ribosomal protein S18 acetylase RimI-like enzyme